MKVGPGTEEEEEEKEEKRKEERDGEDEGEEEKESRNLDDVENEEVVGISHHHHCQPPFLKATLLHIQYHPVHQQLH